MNSANDIRSQYFSQVEKYRETGVLIDTKKINRPDLYHIFFPIFLMMFLQYSKSYTDGYIEALTRSGKVSDNLFRVLALQNQFADLPDEVKLLFKESISKLDNKMNLQIARFEEAFHDSIDVFGQFNFSQFEEKSDEVMRKTHDLADLDARNEANGLYNDIITYMMIQSRCVFYYYKISKDHYRVRGNPSGKYPHAEYSHWARRNKIYDIRKPFPDGNPGERYNCRCYKQPILSV